MSCIRIDHFSDILCVWAYVAQIRMDELKSAFGDKVEVDFHFFPIFGDVPGKIDKSWAERGGLQAYNAHVLSVAEPFDHIRVNPEVWVGNTPRSSLPAHLFMLAVKDAENSEEIAKGSFVRIMQGMRDAFFMHARDISNYSTLLEIVDEQNLPVDLIRGKVECGIAHSAICANMHKAVDLGIKSSPTLIFNEGRQKLSGNVGYRIIEANIRELLENPAGQQSWC